MDEELLGLYLEAAVKRAVEPIVYTYAVGLWVGSRVRRSVRQFEELISPELPSFTIE